jgi:hypothetical protein
MPPVENGVSAGGPAARRWDPIQEARQESLKTPEDNLRDEINKVLAARLESVRGEVASWLNPELLAQITSRIDPATNNPLPESQLKNRVENALTEKIKEIVASQSSPLFDDVGAVITRAGLSIGASPSDPSGIDPVELEKSCVRHLALQIEETVRDVFKERQAAKDRVELDAKEVQALKDRIDLEKKGEFFKEIGETPVHKISPEKLDGWIKEGAAKLSKEERQRLVNTGLIELEGTDPGPSNGPGTFRRLRALSNLSWAVSIPTIVGLAEANLLGVFGDVRSSTIALGIICATAIGNLACQFVLSRRRENQMKNIWHEAKSELSGVDLDRAVAWIGIMYKIVSQLSPVYVLKDRTDMLNGGQPSSVSAVLGHLKLAACVAVDSQLNKEGDRYYKGVNYKDKIALTESGLKDLEARWNWWGWGVSSRVAIFVGLAVPFFSYFAYVDLVKGL